MENLNAEQIICGLMKNDSCYVEDKECIQNAIALIKSQEQRIAELETENMVTSGEVERLNLENDELTEGNKWAAKRILEADKKVAKLTSDNERLNNRCIAKIVIDGEKLEEIKNECLARVELDIKAIQSDTVRKMRERLKVLIKSDYINGTREQAMSAIDQIANELSEGINNV